MSIPNEIWVGEIHEQVKDEVWLRCDKEQIGIDDVKFVRADLIGWQSIETAPKDGTPILLKGGYVDEEDDRIKELDPKRPVVASYCTFEDEWVWAVAKYDMICYITYEDPTHWMPLPKV